jgi:hypothetical protein
MVAGWRRRVGGIGSPFNDMADRCQIRSEQISDPPPRNSSRRYVANDCDLPIGEFAFAGFSAGTVGAV